MWRSCSWHLSIHDLGPKCSGHAPPENGASEVGQYKTCACGEREYQKLAANDKGLSLVVQHFANLRHSGVRVAVAVSHNLRDTAVSRKPREYSRQIYGYPALVESLKYCPAHSDGDYTTCPILELYEKPDHYAQLV